MLQGPAGATPVRLLPREFEGLREAALGRLEPTRVVVDEPELTDRDAGDLRSAAFRRLGEHPFQYLHRIAVAALLVADVAEHRQRAEPEPVVRTAENRSKGLFGIVQ